MLQPLCTGEEKDGGGLRINIAVTLVLVGTDFFFLKNGFGHMHLCYLRMVGIPDLYQSMHQKRDTQSGEQN